MRLDVHQHIWTPPLLEALERRRQLPFARRNGGQLTLYLAGEAPSVIDDAGETLERRVALLEEDGVDRALIALSSPLGIEALPRADAQELIDAHLAGLTQLDGPFDLWGPLPLEGLSALDVDAVLARGCVGVSLPAGALATPRLVRHLEDALARAESLGAPVFIHPGPGLGERAPEVGLDDPLWWPAMTLYVTQMQAAWLTFQTAVRRSHPYLRVVFAMLAGCAPLLTERLTARGGPRLEGTDELTYYETSSYGPVAVDAMAHRVGLGRLLYGSDRPVIGPPKALSATFRQLFLDGNAAWLSERLAVAA
ncbi:MAG: amidohydrolase [Solirubrobacteraceae bacterium]